MAERMVCPNCGTVDLPRTYTKGSFGMEVVLWLLFLVPGLLYSLWRLGTRYRGCPVCGGDAMIPLGTPRANQILAARSMAATPPTPPQD